MLGLAAQNLHQPDVLTALIEVLPEVQDVDTRRQLLSLLMDTDGSRFPSLDALYSALVAALQAERERSIRAAILRRLGDGLHQDERLVPLFVEMLAHGGLADEETAAVTETVSSLASVSEAVAVSALQQAGHAPAGVQALALTIAEACPHWGDAIARELPLYLEPRVERGLRLRVLRRLAEARSLSAAYLPVLTGILRRDPDAETRAAALEELLRLQTWEEAATLQLLWTAANDSDPSLRARAVHLQAEAPELSDEQVADLAGRLAGDDLAQVREEVLGLLRGRLGDAALRQAVATAFVTSPSAFAWPELSLLLELIAPYAGRDPAVRDSLLGSLPRLRPVRHRQLLLEAVLLHVRPGDAVDALVAAFRNEHQPELREALFQQLRPLSVTRYPGLVTAYCTELGDPTSSFRTECATALAGAVATHPEVVAAFEDVLSHDDGAELVRTCLEAYLKPSVSRRFEVLLALMDRESVELRSRQQCLDGIDRAALSAAEAQELDDLLAGPGGAGLRSRK
jgi:hypothetical protein